MAKKKKLTWTISELHLPRTWASVTTVPCTCGYLQRSADDPDVPIIFDPQTAEYQFKSGGHTLIIYHCPFCGGAAPKSKRDLLFAVIPAAEESHLASLLAPVTTIRRALRRLGKPDRDDRSTCSSQPEKDGNPPRMQRHRTLIYEHLSDTADIWITEHPSGHASWYLQGKYLGKPAT